MNVGSIIASIVGIINQLIGALFIVATVVFLWGIIQYVIAGGDEDKIKTAKNYIIWGVLGLFVMVAMWGIVFAICATTGIQCSGAHSGNSNTGNNTGGGGTYSYACVDPNTCAMGSVYTSNSGLGAPSQCNSNCPRQCVLISDSAFHCP